MLVAVATAASLACWSPEGTPPCHTLSIEAVAVDATARVYVVGSAGDSTFAPALQKKRLNPSHVLGNAGVPPFQPAWVLATSLDGSVEWLRTLDTGDGQRSNLTAGAATIGTDVVVFGSGAAATRVDATGATVASFGTESVATSPLLPMTGPRAPAGTTTADGSIVVALDENATLARIEPTGRAVWSVSVLPRPALLVPDLTGGVWIVNPRVVHLDPAGAAGYGTGATSGASSGTAVRDVSGNEMLVLASYAGVTALTAAGALAWTRGDVRANAIAADGDGNLIAIGWGDGTVRATWLDTAGTFVASATFATPELSGGDLAGAASGAPRGAVIALGTARTSSTDTSAPASSCAAPAPRLLSARTADHSLTAIAVDGLTAPESP